MNAFAQALLAQAKIQQAKEQAAPVTIAPTDACIPCTNTIATPPIDDSPLVVTLDIVVNRRRLDLSFNRKPSEEIRLELLKQGWRFTVEPVKHWYHQDNAQNRRFLCEYFDCDIMESDAPATDAHWEHLQNMQRPAGWTVAEPAAPAAPAAPEVTEAPEVKNAPYFLKYRAQVNELLSHLKCEPADLMLLAIDCMHKATFSRDS